MVAANRVYWKEHELKNVSRCAWQIYEESGYAKTWISCVFEGQQIALDSDRWRPKTSLYATAISDKKYDLESLKAIGKAAIIEEKAEREKQAETRKRIQELHEKSVSHVDELVNQLIPTESALEAKIGPAVEKIANLFRTKLATRLSEVINEVFDAVDYDASMLQLPKLRQDQQPKQVKVEKKKPRILIVGMLPKHATCIHRDFDEFFDMDFLETDKVTRITEKSNGKDHVILNTSFINHSIQAKVRKHKGLILVSGNNAVSEKLLEMAIANADK